MDELYDLYRVKYGENEVKRAQNSYTETEMDPERDSGQLDEFFGTKDQIKKALNGQKIQPRVTQAECGFGKTKNAIALAHNTMKESSDAKIVFIVGCEYSQGELLKKFKALGIKKIK